MSNTIKGIIFYPMFWLRGIFLLVGKLLGGFLLLGGIFEYFIGAPTIIWSMTLTFSFLIFILRQTYDTILLKLNPTGRDLILFQ